MMAGSKRMRSGSSTRPDDVVLRDAVKCAKCVVYDYGGRVGCGEGESQWLT